MTSLSIKRPVTLKVIVTEPYKRQLIAELKEAIERIDSNIQQLDAQMKRYLLELHRQDISHAIRFRQQMEAEKSKQEAVKRQLELKLKEVEELPLGSEYPHTTLESFVVVNVGDNLERMLTETEVVVEDGIIKEIRESRQ